MTDIIAPNPFPIVPVITADREALYGGLTSAAHPVAYARRMADTLPDSDGGLQMLARYRLATRSPELERLSERIAEVVEEDGGCWHACSGCQESSEGYVSERDYPYSPLFKCQPGGGCRECGGIGVLWTDGAFLASYGEDFPVLSATPAEEALAYERQYFERGFIAAAAWAMTKREGFNLSDDVIDHAWAHRDEGMDAEDILPVATPTPGALDPATVERSVEDYAYDELWGAIAAATRVEAGMVAISVVKFREAIRSLATDPHQHGGKEA